MRQRARLAPPVVLLSAFLLGGCGGGDDQTHDAERLARCISQGSGSLLTDPLNERPVEFRLSPALRDRARSKPRVGEGSILPRPTSFAAFVGVDPTHVPPDFEGSDYAPAAFVFFDSSSAARAQEGDADLRRENVLVVFDGGPGEDQVEFIDSCL